MVLFPNPDGLSALGAVLAAPTGSCIGQLQLGASGVSTRTL